jgi:xanthine dehydrogenase small subunit
MNNLLAPASQIIVTLLIIKTTSLIRFILNEKEVVTSLPPGTVLLDFIRYHQHLMGTKIGCREGDCGACTVLAGEIKGNNLQYQSMTCCLMPLGNANGKHIVTIEGINHTEGLNPLQKAIAEEGATQCGFCTPGFIISLAGFCLSDMEATKENAIAALDGNICRCTGYKSIERAAAKIAEIMKERNGGEAAAFVVKNKILPSYFSTIKSRLQTILNGQFTTHDSRLTIVGGGTDLYVQKHDEMTDADIRFIFDIPSLNGITREATKCIIGPSATVTDLKNSSLINKAFPDFPRYAKLVSSTPIRNMATIAGNFINASPIGDFTIFFLALDAQLCLTDGKTKRELPLRKLYKGYKQLDKKPDEYIEQVWFELPAKNSLFNFEKVSKRTNLDIATVNSAISITMNENMIQSAGISAGGVGPVPVYLQKTSAFFNGKAVTEELVHEAIGIAETEISPISDTRGTREYKKFLLGQLIKAHFITLFPGIKSSKLIST